MRSSRAPRAGSSPSVSPRWTAPPERAVPPLSRNLRDSPDLGSGLRVDRLSPSVRPAVDRPDLLSRVASLGRFVGLRDSGEVAPSAPRCRGLSRPRLSAVQSTLPAPVPPSVLDERRLHDGLPGTLVPRISTATSAPSSMSGGEERRARSPARASARSSRSSPRRSARRPGSPGTRPAADDGPRRAGPAAGGRRLAPSRPAAAPGPGSRPCRSGPPSPARPASGVMPGPSSWPCSGRPASRRSVSRAPRPAGTIPAATISRQSAGGVLGGHMDLDAVLAGVPRAGDDAVDVTPRARVRPRTAAPRRSSGDTVPSQLARLRSLHREHRPGRRDVGDLAVAALRRVRVFERADDRVGVRRVRHDEQLVVVDPPHDDVVDDVGVVGIEQVRVLRPARTDPAEVVGERPLEHRHRARPGDPHRPEVRHVEHDRVLPARPVLLEHAAVLDRHVPAAELGQARVEGAVLGVERAVAQVRRFGHRRSRLRARAHADSASAVGEPDACAASGGSTSRRSGGLPANWSLSCDGGSSPYFTSRCR